MLKHGGGADWRQKKRKPEEDVKRDLSEVVQKRKTDNQGKINDFFQKKEEPQMEPLLSQAFEYDEGKLDDEIYPATNEMARTTTHLCRIYGQMHFPALISEIMDTKQVQRLGDLMQLGVSHLVFRTATHTRLEHSLGVTFLAGKLMDIISQQRRDDKKLRQSNFRCHEWWTKGGGIGADCSLCTDEKGRPKTIIAKISDADRLCVLVAALCHDLGHGPYSHMFEHVVKHMQSELDREEEDRWTHEKMSVRMLHHLIEDNQIDLAAHGLDPVTDLRFIEELILGSDLEGGLNARRGRGKDKAFLYDIVNNAYSGLDVDKLDYFMRDTAAALGAKIDLPNDFLENARVAWVPASGKEEGRWAICWPSSLLEKAPNLFNIRYRMHKEVYQQRKVKCFEHVVSAILVKVVSEPLFTVIDKHGTVTRKSIEEAIWDPQAFLRLNDHILDVIFNAAPPFRNAEGMREARLLCDSLWQREIWSHVGTTRVEIPDRQSSEEAAAYQAKTKREILAHREEVERVEEREEEMEAIPETPQEEEQEQEHDGEVQMSQQMTPHKRPERAEPSSSGQQAGAAKPSSSSRSSSRSASAQSGRHRVLADDDMLVDVVTMHHGKKSQDPVRKMNFFGKTAAETGVWTAEAKDPRIYESATPAVWQSHEIRVLVRNKDKIEVAIKCHKAWCKANNHPEPISMPSQDVDSDSFSLIAG